MAFSDPRALHQVLLNIMSNAIDALAGINAPLVSFQIRQGQGQVQITISDNGCGIPDHRNNELFLPFFSGKPQGVGLGLSIARKLLTQMGGAIEINSRQDQGTEARITLPAAFSHEH
jgi:C4-dicarboxylate-specific signal transduction histidine kinase